MDRVTLCPGFDQGSFLVHKLLYAYTYTHPHVPHKHKRRHNRTHTHTYTSSYALGLSCQSQWKHWLHSWKSAALAFDIAIQSLCDEQHTRTGTNDASRKRYTIKDNSVRLNVMNRKQSYFVLFAMHGGPIKCSFCIGGKRMNHLQIPLMSASTHQPPSYASHVRLQPMEDADIGGAGIMDARYNCSGTYSAWLTKVKGGAGPRVRDVRVGYLMWVCWTIEKVSSQRQAFILLKPHLGKRWGKRA